MLKHKNRAFVLLEVALVGLLGWIILTSDSVASNTAQDGTTIQAKQARKRGRSRARFLPTEGIEENRSADLLAMLGTPNACQSFDLESNVPGFQVIPVFGTPLQLWHTSNLCRANLPGHSTPTTFYYGQDGTCNYNTGARNAANLLTPTVSLAGLLPPFVINFNYLLFVEVGGFDSTFVDVSNDNGATWTQVLSKANLINDNQWHNVISNVTPQVGAGTSIKLRFRFDSVDNIANSTTGWHIDDITVCGEQFSANSCIQDDSNHSVLKYNPGTGAYEFNNCQGTIVTGIGTVSVKGLLTTLQDSRADRRILVKIDKSVMKASATIQLFSPSRSFSITDRNTGDNTCACPF